MAEKESLNREQRKTRRAKPRTTAKAGRAGEKLRRGTPSPSAQRRGADPQQAALPGRTSAGKQKAPLRDARTDTFRRAEPRPQDSRQARVAGRGRRATTRSPAARRAARAQHRA